MTDKSISLFFLMYFALLPGCSVTISNSGPIKQGSGMVAGTLLEIKKDCTLCHTTNDMRKGAAQLKKPAAALCLDCHPGRKSPGEHKIDIVPSMPVKRLPLAEGKLTCITCHDPHQNTFGSMLRMPKAELCMECHPY